MPYILWNARYIPPDERKRADNVRSDMRYGATREGVDRLDKDLRPQAMSGKEGLEYIARRRGAAAFEPDGDAVYNPTALPVWFEAMEYSNYTFKSYCVQPGELLRLHK